MHTVIDLTTLPTSQGYVIQGGIAGGRSGTWVSNAGDINGDGIADFLIGAPGTGSGAGGAGRVYVIFGTNGPPRTGIDLAALSPSDGFTIIGQPNDSGNGDPGSGTGINVSNAGDVNGDGIADLIIGADRANPIGNGNNGAAYVIYGRSGGARADITLDALSPSDGFAIVGGLGTGELDSSGSARLGFSVSGAGDVNGDGLADVIVGAPMVQGDSPDGNNPAGQAFVIFGRAGATRATIDVDALAPTDGFSISGSQGNPFAGVSVSGAGDFNNDGFADIIVGASRIDAVASAGVAAYVIFGQAGASRSNVALDNPASYAGARIQVNVGEVANSASGNRFEVLLQNGGATNGLLTYYDPDTIDPIWIVSTRVSSAGDVNGDGFADLVIGIPENQTNFFGATGARPTGSFIVYGRAGADLADFSVIGSANGSNQLFGGVNDLSQLGYSVSNAGDINADGIDDFIVGRPNVNGGTLGGGYTYVVFGRAGGIGDLALTDTLFTGPLTSDRGLTLVVDGVRAGDRAGTSVSAAGDVNNDGIADLIVGAPLPDDGGTNAGRSYVVYGARFRFGGGDDVATNSVANEAFDGLGGFDHLNMGTYTSAITLNTLAGTIVSAQGSNDTVTNVEFFTLGSGDDVVTFGDSGFVVRTGLGNDQVTGGTGRDLISGGDGDDILAGGSGAANELGGGAGDDIYIVSVRGDSTIEAAGGGYDEVRTTLGVYQLQANIEALTFTDNAAHGAGIGNALDNAITGGTGRDDLFGRAGNDTLTGGTGAANTLVGGAGDDVYVVSVAGDSIIEAAGEGTDEVITTLNLFTLRDNVEVLTFTGTGAFTGIGSSTDNLLYGGDSNDFLSGLGGNDKLVGGAGADILIGGAGADEFAMSFNGTPGIDRILDFTSGTDKLSFDNRIVDQSQNFVLVQGAGAHATTFDATFLYDSDTGRLSYDRDGAAAGAAVVYAILNPGLTLAPGDFIIY